jgi:hypothetical protein
MKLIAHRGNVNGINAKMENHPDYIDTAIDLGYDVEVDMWSISDKLYFGHDEPTYKIPIDCLMNRASKLWVHCKNHEAFEILSRYQSLNVFWHQTDDFALTTKGYTWCYPGVRPVGRSVAVLPEYDAKNLNAYYAICSDHVAYFKEVYDKNTNSSVS